MSLEDFSNLPKDKKLNLDYHLGCIDWDTRAFEGIKVDIALEKEKLLNLKTKINYREKENKEIDKMIKFRKQIIKEFKEDIKKLQTI